MIKNMTDLHIERAFRISPEAAATFCNGAALIRLYVYFKDDLLYPFLVLLRTLNYHLHYFYNTTLEFNAFYSEQEKQI
jgi:hypothetical protein